jgi:hypothetical protein
MLTYDRAHLDYDNNMNIIRFEELNNNLIDILIRTYDKNMNTDLELLQSSFYSDFLQIEKITDKQFMNIIDKLYSLRDKHCKLLYNITFDDYFQNPIEDNYHASKRICLNKTKENIIMMIDEINKIN